MQAMFEAIVEQLRALFDPTTLAAEAADLIVSLVVALVVFAVYLIILWLALRGLRSAFRRRNVDQTTATFVQTAVKYTLLVAGFINAMAAIGIPVASLLASLGIAGFTIGFAAKDAFSNLISGLLIYLDRPFVIGDLVEIEDFYGRVDQITLRSTRIITSDGKMLAVPNADIINKTVASYTNFRHLRLDIEVTIGVEEDINRVRQLLLGLVENDPAYLTEPAARVIVTQLNDYNVAVELQAWLRNEREHVTRRADLRELVFSTLTQAGIDMPYETINISPLKVTSLS